MRIIKFTEIEKLVVGVYPSPYFLYFSSLISLRDSLVFCAICFAIITEAALIIRRIRLSKAISLTSSGMREQNYMKRGACKATTSIRLFVTAQITCIFRKITEKTEIST